MFTGIKQFIRGKVSAFGFMIRYGYGHLIPVAVVKYLYNKLVLPKYGIDPWHDLPAELRPHAMDIVHFINKRVQEDFVVVEIGCGVGDILSKVQKGTCIGFDINPSVVQAAQDLHSNTRTSYRIGGFPELIKLKLERIDFLVCMQVLHHVSSAQLRQYLEGLLQECEVRTICVDRLHLPDHYDHDFADLLPECYTLVSDKTYKHPDFTGPQNLIYTRTDIVDQV